MRAMRRLMMPSAGATTSVRPRRQVELAALRLDLRLLGLGDLQPVVGGDQLGLRPCGRPARGWS